MESWLNKTQIMTMLMQSQDTKPIHPTQRKEMLIPKQKLQAQWGTKNNAIKENASQRRADKEEEEYIKTAAKTEIMQLVATRPEMPAKLELRREDRKKLTEMMLGYLAKTESEEEEWQWIRSSADITHASSVKSHSEHQLGRRIIYNAQQNADKYIRKKNSQTNARTAAETSDGMWRYESKGSTHAHYNPQNTSPGRRPPGSDQSRVCAR